MKKLEKHKNGLGFLLLGLLAFMGLGLEIPLAFMVEMPLYRIDTGNFNDYTTTENILHWIFTCILWGIVAFILIKLSQKKLRFDFMTDKSKPGKLQFLIAVALLGISVAISIWDWNGIKVIKEFEYNGWLKFIFQYIYYIFEVVLVLLIIVFGQKFGELMFKQNKIPWGGILVGLTWGLVHILTKGDIQTGLIASIGGVMYGITYLVLQKNTYISYLFILLMFVL
jgi:hypothetical protein